MAKLKAEFLAHYYESAWRSDTRESLGKIHTLSKLASNVAPLANLRDEQSRRSQIHDARRDPSGAETLTLRQ